MSKFFCLCTSPAIDALVKLPRAPKVEVVDTTSAGDTLLAEWCRRCFSIPTGERTLLSVPEDQPNAQECAFSDCARWAVAAGSAACTMPGSQPPAVETVSQLKETL